jgi:hypothetical protein
MLWGSYGFGLINIKNKIIGPDKEEGFHALYR